jgi:pyruvate kinase
MLSVGVTGFRLNTSHLSTAELTRWLERLENFTNELEKKPFVVLDLQGSKWRLGQFPTFKLKKGETIELAFGLSSDKPQVLPVPHEDFFQAAEMAMGEIILNDARSRLIVENGGKGWLKAKVIEGGIISANKGITVSESEQRLESLGEKDRMIFEMTRQLDFMRYAISYVKDAVEMERYRALLGEETYLIAKLERQPALCEANKVARFSDELWVCRGDLASELGIRGMAEAVAQFHPIIATIIQPIIMAGQVLEHMTGYDTPTRSEMCYLYDILQGGYHGVVLSDETALGKDPINACRMAALFK